MVEKGNEYDYQVVHSAINKLERHLRQNGPGSLVCVQDDEIIIEGSDEFVECQELEAEYAEDERNRYELKRRHGLA